MHFPSKLPDVGTTIFTVMTRLASQHNAINLSQGFPDFDCDPELVELVCKYMRDGHNQYAPMQGIPVLRERIAEKTQELYGATFDHDTEITISSGATEALFAAITAAVQPGDEVLILSLLMIPTNRRSKSTAAFPSISSSNFQPTTSIGMKSHGQSRRA